MTANYHLTEEEIAICADAVNDNQYEDIPQELKNHVEECSQCMQEVLFVSEISIKSEPDIFKNGNAARFKKTWMIPAGIIAVAAAVLLLFLVRWESNLLNMDENLSGKEMIVSLAEDDEKGDTTLQQDVGDLEETTRRGTEKPNHKIPENKIAGKLLTSFTPHKDLEYLYNNHKGNYRGEKVKVISDSVLNLQSVTSFEWDNVARKNLIIEIFNNHNKSVKTIHTDNIAGAEIPGLKPGLYYWKLVNEDFDLLYVGKIIVPLPRKQ